MPLLFLDWEKGTTWWKVHNYGVDILFYKESITWNKNWLTFILTAMQNSRRWSTVSDNDAQLTWYDFTIAANLKCCRNSSINVKEDNVLVRLGTLRVCRTVMLTLKTGPEMKHWLHDWPWTGIRLNRNRCCANGNAFVHIERNEAR